MSREFMKGEKAMLDRVHNADVGKLILRLTAGILILFHGVAKIVKPETIGWIGQQLGSYGLPSFLAYGVYVGEVVAPVLIILGLFTRLGGLLVAINMLVALALAHTHELFNIGDHGQWVIELQIFYLMTGIAIFFLGSGKYAVKPDVS